MEKLLAWKYYHNHVVLTHALPSIGIRLTMYLSGRVTGPAATGNMLAVARQVMKISAKV
jgi:hypothetical protein